MLEVRSLCVTAATGALVLVLIPAGPSAQQPPPPMAPVLQNYKPVTADRLKKLIVRHKNLPNEDIPAFR